MTPQPAALGRRGLGDVTEDQPPRAPRFEVTIFMVTGEEMEPLGRTRDLSASGAFLETSSRPTIGSEQEVGFVWGDDTVTCRARVVRHAGDGFAITFLAPDDHFLRVLQEVTETATRKP